MKPNETLAQDRVRHDETAPEIKAGGPRRIAAPAVHTRRADPVAALTRTIETQNRRLEVKMVSRTEAARRLAAAKANATHHLRATVDQRNGAARKGRADPLLDQTINRINRHIDRVEADERRDLQTQLAAEKARTRQLETKLRRPMIQPPARRASLSQRNQAFALYRKASLAYLRTGQETFGGVSLRELEKKAGMHSGSNPDGGFFVHPELDTGPLEGLLSNAVVMRQVATVQSISGPSFKKPVNLRGATVEWVGERQNPPDTNTPDIAEIDVPAMEMAANVLASQTLIEDSSLDIESFLAEEVLDTFGQEEERVFSSGNGVNKPRGLWAYDMVANDSWAWEKFGFTLSGKNGGFPDPGAAVNQADPLWTLIYSLKPAYRNSAKFMMNSGLVGRCRQLKDGEGRWIWADARDSNPAQLCGYEVVVNEQAPNGDADAFPIAFGDFARTYLIVDRVGVTVLRDPYTRTPYIRFYTRKRVGGGVKNFEATKFLKFAQ
jgi:HK97 family phage major capsid protein